MPDTSEKQIWQFFKGKGLNDFAVAGIMGNLYAESGLNPCNLQNTYEKKLGYSDTTYTAAVDSGEYGNFVRDCAGYGLAQWTYWSRKEALLSYARSVQKSIGDLTMQLEFMWKELQGYTGVMNTLKGATSILAASNAILLNYERPADQSSAVQTKRVGYGQTYYDKYAGVTTDTTTSKEDETMSYTNSPLVAYTKISPNRTKNRNHAIDTITIHCVVGQCSVETLGEVFAPTSRQASSNYGVGVDGRIGMYVEEKDRSWCSSNSANDNRAVTIEVASDTTHPYAVNAKAYAGLLDLVTDICRRNGIKKLVWSTNKSDRVNHKNGCNMTVHRDYANKSCPGDYLYNRHGEIAAEVNKRLDATSGDTSGSTTSDTSKNLYRVQVGAFKVKDNADAMLASVKAKGFEAFVTQVSGLYKVQVGAYSVKANAENQLAKMKAAGFTDAFITEGSGGSTTTPKKTVDELAKEVIAGKWGNGADRKQRLTAAGYDYSAVQARVNALLS